MKALHLSGTSKPYRYVTNLAKSDGDGDAPHRVEVPLYEGLNGGDTAL